MISAARGQLRRPPRADLPIVASVGLLQVAGGVLIVNLALQVVPAGRSAVLVYTQPLWVAVILAAVLRVPPLRNELVGLVLGIAGLVLLLNPAVIDWSDGAEVAGVLALLLNAVLWAACRSTSGVTPGARAPPTSSPGSCSWRSCRWRWRRSCSSGRADHLGPATILILLYAGPRHGLRVVGEPGDHPLAGAAGFGDGVPSGAGRRAGQRLADPGRATSVPRRGRLRARARRGGRDVAARRGWRDRARRWKLAPSNPPRAAVGYLPGPTAGA